MDSVSQRENEMILPLPGEIAEARFNPGGWVYRVAGSVGPSDAIPPEAIMGAWKVDHRGRIDGDFIAYGKYDADRWPAESE